MTPGKIVWVSILGTRVIRTEDPRFLTRGGIYTDDMRLPGACHVHFVRSTVAHARIASIDISAALEARLDPTRFTSREAHPNASPWRSGPRPP